MTNLKQIILDNVHIVWDEPSIFNHQWISLDGYSNDISFNIDWYIDATTVGWITSDNNGVITKEQQNLSLEEAKHLCKEHVADYLLKFLKKED